MKINIKKLKELAINLNILYVEDDLSIQRTMTKYLNKFFLTVTIASNGNEALKLYEKDKFDIVITDLSMPQMNGLDMIEKIQQKDENQAIIITTAHGESNFLLSAIRAHVDGYLIKPFDYEELNFELFKTSQKIVKFRENRDYKEHLQDMLKKKTEELNDNYEKSIYSMVDLIEQRDTYTAGHSKRVAHYCELIARDMGYSNEDCTRLHQAAMLHDVGKIETPDSILLNPKSLNEIEYKLIQEHVSVGYKLLSTIPMFEALANIVHAHHERYDGSGYPNGLKGDEIEELARIIIVADAFDAMTTSRIYKARKTIVDAIGELLSLSKKQFDPKVVKSASRVLKSIHIDNNINQLPTTKLEEERFAYFYKDNITQAYNQNYLDVVLIKNITEKNFHYMTIFSINNFSIYNKRYSWEDGNKLLKKLAVIFIEQFPQAFIFRIFGDDFAIMSHKKIETQKTQSMIKNLLHPNSLDYREDVIDLKVQKIENLTDIEAFF